MAGRLTTHVLDTAQGRPAAGLAIELWQLEPGGDGRRLLRAVRTNADGRTDAPLLNGDELVAGIYELVFAIGAYFADQPVAVTNPPFLDRVPVRFGIADPTAHYHVPLLASPWAYSTYRGS
jgi:5-hydroxyisourate hydrolase